MTEQNAAFTELVAKVFRVPYWLISSEPRPFVAQASLVEAPRPLVAVQVTGQNAPADPAIEAATRLPLCPECGESLAAHLAQFCPATEGVLHA